MCSRGVFQLNRVYIQFCDWGGSSKNVRKLLESQKLKQFMTENPQIEFEFYKRRNHHPYISSTYINGYVKDFPLLNLSEDEIIEALNRVKNQSGRKFLPHKGQRVYGTKKSVQGIWNENLWNKQPEVELEKLRGPEKPEIQFELIDRDTNKSKYVYHKDIVKSFLKQQDKKWEKGEYL